LPHTPRAGNQRLQRSFRYNNFLVERADSLEKTRVGLLCFRTACSKAALSNSMAITSKTRVLLLVCSRKAASDVRFCPVTAPRSRKTSARSPQSSPTSCGTFSAPSLAELLPLIQLSSSESRADGQTPKLPQKMPLPSSAHPYHVARAQPRRPQPLFPTTRRMQEHRASSEREHRAMVLLRSPTEGMSESQHPIKNHSLPSPDLSPVPTDGDNKRK